MRDRRIRRPLAIFGAVPNNAPVLSKGQDAGHRLEGRYDKRGVLIQHVGTVGIKHTPLCPAIHRRRQGAREPPRPLLRRTAAGILRRPASESYNPSKTASRRSAAPATNRSTPSSMPTPPPTTRSCGCTAPPKADWDRLEVAPHPKEKPKEAAPAAQPEKTGAIWPLRQVPQKPARASGGDFKRMEAMTDPVKKRHPHQVSGSPARCRRQLLKRWPSPPSSRCASSSAASATTSCGRRSGKGARPRLGDPVGGEHQGSDA